MIAPPTATLSPMAIGLPRAVAVGLAQDSGITPGAARHTASPYCFWRFWSDNRDAAASSFEFGSFPAPPFLAIGERSSTIDRTSPCPPAPKSPLDSDVKKLSHKGDYAHESATRSGPHL